MISDGLSRPARGPGSAGFRVPMRVWLPALLVALNGVIGIGIAAGHSELVLLAALPVIGLVVAWLLADHRDALIFAAIGLPMLAGSYNDRLPGTGGTAIYPADILVMLSLAVALVERLVGRARPERRGTRTPVLGWPFLFFAIAIIAAIIRGHERYGAPYANVAARMFIYAGIAAAMAGLTPERAYRGITKVMYVGIVAEVLTGLYHLASGTSQSNAVSLSTGGVRALALTSAMYLAAALVLALLNVERAEAGRQRLIHLAFVALAAFGIVISFSRTAFVAAGVLVPLLFMLFRKMRRSVLSFVPLLIPVAALGIVLALQLAPSLGSTLGKRLSGTPTNDTSLIERERKWHASLQGLSSDPLRGVGFGRPDTFTQINGQVVTFVGDPENSYLWILAGGGYLALGSFLLLVLTFFGSAIRRAIRATGETRALIVFSMSLVFIFLVNTLTFPLLSDPPEMLVLWVAMLLPGLAPAVSRRDVATV